MRFTKTFKVLTVANDEILDAEDKPSYSAACAAALAEIKRGANDAYVLVQFEAEEHDA